MRKSKKSKTCPVFVSIASNKGRVRAVNEDNFYADILGTREIPDLCGHRVLDHSDRYVFGVCDGMGGEQFGDVASEIAACTMREFSDIIKISGLKNLHNAGIRRCLNGEVFFEALIPGKRLIHPPGVFPDGLFVIEVERRGDRLTERPELFQRHKGGFFHIISASCM